jgi:type II secretion system protein H
VARASTPTLTRGTSDGRGAERATVRSERGFTLLEIAVTCALIGLLVTLVLPKLGLLGGVSLQSSARQLASRIELLREDAALKSRTVRLSFDPRNGRYRAEVLTDMHDGSGARFVADESPLYRTVKLPGSIRLELDGPGVRNTTEGAPAVIFWPDGYADPLVVRLSTGGDETWSVVVEPARARPRLVDHAITVDSRDASSSSALVPAMGGGR